jgi:hypothetical protein
MQRRTAARPRLLAAAFSSACFFAGCRLAALAVMQSLAEMVIIFLRKILCSLEEQY